jgi:hypothetical protein
LNGVHRLLICADDLSLFRDNINATKKSSDALIGANKDVGLEVNTEKTKYMLMSHRQNTGQIHNIKIANRSVEYTEKFKYLGKTLLNQNCIHE